MATIEEESLEGLNLLVVGHDLGRVDAFVSPLRRAAYGVTRVLLVPNAIKLAKENAFDLVALVLPLASAWDLVKSVRAEGSASRRTALVVVADGSLLPEIGTLMSPQVNRLLPAESRPEDLLQTVDQMLHAAPRVNVVATARLHFGPMGSESRIFAVENVSSSGMLLRGPDPPALGTTLGFELLVPSVGAPIRGQAQLVRLTASRRLGEQGMAMNFVSFGGEGAKQLEKLVSKERAASGAPEWKRGQGGGGGGTVRIKNLEQLAARREELEELEPYLDELLAQGLVPRVKTADWYVAAAELGMESLRAFSAILEAVHSGRSRRLEVSQQLLDLTDVRRGLGDFAGPKQTVESRIRILLGMRRSLERLLKALSLLGTPEKDAASAKPRGVIADLALEIKRLMHDRKYLGDLPGRLAELNHPRYLFARKTLKLEAEAVVRDFSTWKDELGLGDGEVLRTARGRRATHVAALVEMRHMDERLKAIHQKIYVNRLKGRAAGDLAADFEEAKLVAVLSEALAKGSEFLVRAYSAYRHSLELTGADPRLLDRVSALATAVNEAEHRLSKDAKGAPTLEIAAGR